MAFYPIYSKRFCNTSSGVTSGLTLFTVPAGYVYVLKCIDSSSFEATGAAACLVQIPGVSIWIAQFTGPNIHQQWTGMQVMNAGETCTFVVTSGACSVAISGYQLSS